MLDIKLIRENPKVVKANLEKRKDDEKLEWLDDLVKKDKENNKLQQQIDKLRHKRNTSSKEISELKKEGKDISKFIKEVKDIPDRIKELETKKEEIANKIKYYLMRLPNIMHESVPYGKDDSENVEVKKWGKPKKTTYELKTHSDLIEYLEIGDFKKAVQVSGAGFYYLFGKLSMLNNALMMYAMDFLTKKGFTVVTPPLMLNRQAYEGVTDLSDFENVMYKIEDEDLYMIATSEHPIAALLMNETIPEEKLPLKLCGFSPCFRKEIGSHGVDTRGLFRTHQFWKIEQFIFCKPEDSWKHHEELQKNSEDMYKAMKIPFRAVNICTGDLGIIAAKKYDIEAWFPRQEKYGEVGSNSNCTDYQARRLNIKYKTKDGEKKHLHTLNNTAIATSRAMVAILENFQQKDGSVAIPQVLQKFMSNVKVIKKE